MQPFDVIILGAGAAGLMCAIEAGKRGRRVAVLERSDRIGKKILISGGGRCNFTNLHCRPENFLSANPHFAKSALAQYGSESFIALVKKHRIPFHEKTLGQLFCDHSAHDIVSMLEQECLAAGVRIFANTDVREVAIDGSFALRTASAVFHAKKMVVATGGLSIPKMVATAFGYDLARRFGIGITECRPALVPLVWNAEDRKHYSDLAGISTNVITEASGPDGRRRPNFQEKMLFTHRGLSGPAILQVSSYWNEGQSVVIDVAPGCDLTGPLRDPRARRDLLSAKAAFHKALPNRLADRWLERNPPSGWTNHALEELEQRVHRWEVIPEGSEGYDKAEVTAGGISTGELSAKTMESKKVPGLYFIGEVVDVTGHLGGFNFQWAWASGFCAGQSI